MILNNNILNLGDVHGRTEWTIPTFGGMSRFNDWQNDPSKDDIYPFKKFKKIIFIGDYTDSFTIPNVDILHNLKNIITFKKAYPDLVILLGGNHDVQYITGKEEARCQGYRPEAYYDLHDLFNANIELFQLAYQEDNWLWTHAGLTKEFYNNCVLTMKDTRYRFYNITKDMNLVELLNFMFESGNKDLYNVGYSSFGRSLFPSPIWARPEDLDNDPIEYNQIIGHTQSQDVRIVNIKDNLQHIYIDCLGHKKWHILKLPK